MNTLRRNVIFVLALLTYLTSADASSAFKLPDTGQVKCYDSAFNSEVPCAGTGQDGAHSINPMNYRLVGSNSDMVQDINTGLIWQRQDDGNTYNWFEASGTYDFQYNPTTTNVCSSLRIGGYNDWRLPTRKELILLYDYSVPFVAVEPPINGIFLNTKKGGYWSAPLEASWTVWAVPFSVSYVYPTQVHSPAFVRCVRGVTWNQGALSHNGNGVVRDGVTGLEWQQAESGYLSWGDALSYCMTTNLDGHNDWRLPNIKELESIIYHSQCNQPIDLSPVCIDNGYFPYFDPAALYWSSTTDFFFTNSAFLVSYSTGAIGGGVKTDPSGNRARCVRGGQFGGGPVISPPIRKLPLPLDAPIAGLSNAVVITHGWNATAFDWVEQLAQAICLRIGATQTYSARNVDQLNPICSGNGWDVWTVDWSTSAAAPIVGTPSKAYMHAANIGKKIASTLLDKYSYNYFHFIAHSAGSNLIENAAAVISPKGPKIHETFLDAFAPLTDVDPDSNRHISEKYGKHADYVDNIVDIRPLVWSVLDTTDLHLINGVNVDVTPTNDECANLNVADRNMCRHGRPYRFYIKSIDPNFNSAHQGVDSVVNTGNMGFFRTKENGQDVTVLANHKNETCMMDESGNCVLVTSPKHSTLYYFIDIPAMLGNITDGFVTLLPGAGTNLFDSLVFSCSPLTVSGGGGVTVNRAASASTPSEAPALLAVQVSTSMPVNTLSFDWAFSAAGEGVLSVFIDGVQAGQIDQLYVQGLSSTAPEKIYIDDLPIGIHKITFRLDGFSVSGTSAVTMTNVTLGYESAQVVRIAGTPPTYKPTVQKAADFAIDNDIIEMVATPLSGDLAYVGGVTVTLSGGFDIEFTANTAGMTTIIGTVTISSGSVTIDNVAVQ